MTPPTGRVAVLIATRHRPAALRRCLDSLARQTERPAEVIVLDNASDAPLDLPEVSGLSAVRIVRSEVALGVAAARQRLLDETTVPLALLLDDDAFLTRPDVLDGVAEAFAEDDRLAALALPLLDFRSDPPVWLTPARSTSTAPAGPVRPAGYFVGGAHALRVAAVQAVGGYDASFVYGEEELDLSYRLMAAGYRLAYAPALHVEHRPEHPAGQPPRFDPDRLAHRVRNRIVLAWRYLPAPYAAAFTTAWLGLHLRQALQHRALGAFQRGLRTGIRDARAFARTPLSGEALAYAKAHGGRLWW